MKPVTQQWSHATSVDPSRLALTERHLAETVDRCLEHPELARRVGVLAAIDVAESPQLRSRFGPKAEQVVRDVLGEVIARGGQTSEQHSPRSGGGFWILLPETGFFAAEQRLRELSRQVAEAVVDIDGELLRVTPVIGHATFADATSARELCDQTSAALHDASLHLDLVPVKYSRALAFSSTRPAGPHDRLMRLIERFWSPLQIGLILSVMVEMPFIAYVLSWRGGFDLTTLTYPLLAVSLAGAAIAIWIASFRIAASSIENLGTLAPVAASVETGRQAPRATAIVAAYLPGESTTVINTVTALLDHDYPGELQVILAYNAPHELPIEVSLSELAAHDPHLTLLPVEEGTSKAECVSAALPYVSGEFVGIFDADSHLDQGSFWRASRWLSCGHDIVQGHRIVRNGEVSWVTRLVAVDYESTQAFTGPRRAGLSGFGVFGGSNVYWSVDALRQIGSQGLMLRKDVDSSMRSLQDTFAIASDPLLVSSELAPTTLRALWRERIRWAQASAETVGPRTSGSGWMQTVSWLSLQVVPILGFVVWRDGGFGKMSHLIPLFVLLAVYIFTMGVSQGALAYLLANPRIKRHRPWFVLYALHSAVWFCEFKDLIVRVARLNGAVGERRTVSTESEAVRLFLDRASEGVPDFTLNHRNAGTVASICRRLEGIPLAIELVAARVATMDLNDIEARLDKRLSLLTDGTKMALPRQQTLRTVVDWSYDLLSEHERAMLCRLSVFAGGWNLAAAEAVAVTDNTDVFAIADVLGSLVDKSIVQKDQSAFSHRYGLPETIRRFAAEKLAETSDEELELRSAHARFFLDLRRELRTRAPWDTSGGVVGRSRSRPRQFACRDRDVPCRSEYRFRRPPYHHGALPVLSGTAPTRMVGGVYGCSKCQSGRTSQ